MDKTFFNTIEIILDTDNLGEETAISEEVIFISLTKKKKKPTKYQAALFSKTSLEKKSLLHKNSHDFLKNSRFPLLECSNTMQVAKKFSTQVTLRSYYNLNVLA